MIKIIGTLALLAIANVHGFSIQPRIIGGTVSDPADFPFFAFSDVDHNSFCSGTLLNNRWVLTAAHCLHENITRTLYLGIDENNESLDSMEIPPKHQYIHPEFIDAEFPTHDIGLIELPREPVASPRIQPIGLPTECGDALEGIEVVAIGNGRRSYFESGDCIRHIYQTTMTFEACENIERRHEKQFRVICTFANASETIYAGDSGGPLLRRSTGSLIGVTSFIDSESGDFPFDVNAYTAVHLFYDWISEVTGLDLPKCSH